MAKRLSFEKKAIRRLFRNRIIDPNTNCWLWTGRNKIGGYGRLSVDHIRTQVHRFSAHLWLDYDLNSSLLVLHKRECLNKNCFNPEHLYIGTYQDNREDDIALGKTTTGYCNRGHRITSQYHDRTRRLSIRSYCRICRIERVQRWRQKKLTTEKVETP